VGSSLTWSKRLPLLAHTFYRSIWSSLILTNESYHKIIPIFANDSEKYPGSEIFRSHPRTPFVTSIVKFEQLLTYSPRRHHWIQLFSLARWIASTTSRRDLKSTTSSQTPKQRNLVKDFMPILNWQSHFCARSLFGSKILQLKQRGSPRWPFRPLSSLAIQWRRPLLNLTQIKELFTLDDQGHHFHRNVLLYTYKPPIQASSSKMTSLR